MGKVATNMDAVSYHDYKPCLREQILAVYNSLAQEYDVIVLEGAGSPAEINLRDRDIVNMGMAEMAQCPVILVADIDRGGVFAAIYGTLALLHKQERDRGKGRHYQQIPRATWHYSIPVSNKSNRLPASRSWA
ncbi:cobyric acid synthase [Salmonella enterica subsp. enterica serovar Madelia]|nr:cobyric acid synthase [Salmonella enterica subsp. enterica serovar Madelia]